MGYYNSGFYANRRLYDAQYDNGLGRRAGYAAGLENWKDARQALVWSNATEKQKENPDFMRGFESGFEQGRKMRNQGKV